MSHNINKSIGFTPLEKIHPVRNKSLNGVRKHSSLTGFTFIELMLVIIIVGIMVGLSTPLFRKTFANAQLFNLSESIAKLMSYAQEKAIVERASYRFNLNLKEGKYWITVKDDPYTEKDFQRIEGRFGKVYIIPKGISVECKKEWVTFYPNGTSDDFSIHIINQNQKVYTLTNNRRVGYVKIFEGRHEQK